MNLDEDSSPERKREIKKAVPPSKKREAVPNRAGVIKNKRLSEPQREPNVYADVQHPSYSPMSLPPGSPQMQVIPQTVLEFSGGESQDSIGSQPPQAFQRMQYMQNSPQGMMDSTCYSNAQSFSNNGNLSSSHPTLSGMLGTASANNFQTIDEAALTNTYLPQVVDAGFQDLPVFTQQQSSQAPAMYNTQQASPMYAMQASPANSAHSLQSPDHKTQFVSMASTVYGNAYNLHDKLF
jgi:hypothetical protein